jgi:hypothetical protein
MRYWNAVVIATLESNQRVNCLKISIALVEHAGTVLSAFRVHTSEASTR